MEPSPAAPKDPGRDARSQGLLLAFAAYGAWGFFPLYFKALGGLPALEVLAHRIAWSALLLGAFSVGARRTAPLLATLRDRRAVGLLAVTTTLLAYNWGTYVWAVNAGRIVEASLGYYVNPLVNVLLGALFLGERLTRPARVAVALASAGVVVLAVRVGTLPWIPVSLAVSFGFYGLLRKRAPVDAATGLLVETLLLAPAAVGWLALLAARGTGAFGAAPGLTALLVAAGPITVLPLVAFGLALRRLRLATVGFVQYVTPSTQLLLAVGLYGEPFGGWHAAAFALIWASLAIYTADAAWRQRRGP